MKKQAQEERNRAEKKKKEQRPPPSPVEAPRSIYASSASMASEAGSEHLSRWEGVKWRDAEHAHMSDRRSTPAAATATHPPDPHPSPLINKEV